MDATLVINNNGETLTGKLIGRLDTVNAMRIEKEMQPLIDSADKPIVLDCTGLDYICSSGLRLLLSLRKASLDKGGSVTLENVNSDIRQILSITGFVNLFDIR